MNAQLPACKADTLPLSYVPMCVWRVIERPFSVCRRGTALGPPSAAFPRPLSFFVRETAPLTSAGSDPATIALKARLSGLPAVSSCCRVFLGRIHRLTGVTRCGDTGGTISAWFVTFPSGEADGVAPSGAGFLWPCAQTVCPMCPSVRAVKRLSALPERRK